MFYLLFLSIFFSFFHNYVIFLVLLCSFCFIILALIIKNPIFSLFNLLIIFLINTIWLFFLNCDYFALIYLMIYLGAILVLFIFMIMLLDLKERTLALSHVVLNFVFIIFSLIFSFCFCLNYYMFFFDVSLNFTISYLNFLGDYDKITLISLLNLVFFTKFYLCFILIGYLLSLSLVIVVSFTHILNQKLQYLNQSLIFVHSRFN